jgi:hypothetical protein
MCATSGTTDWYLYLRRVEICRDYLLLPCKMQLSQPLSEDGIARHCTFSRDYFALLEDSPGVLNDTWFFSELHFHLDFFFPRMALPAHSGLRSLIHFRNHFSQTGGLLGRVISPS